MGLCPLMFGPKLPLHLLVLVQIYKVQLIYLLIEKLLLFLMYLPIIDQIQLEKQPLNQL